MLSHLEVTVISLGFFLLRFVRQEKTELERCVQEVKDEHAELQKQREEERKQYAEVYDSPERVRKQSKGLEDSLKTLQSQQKEAEGNIKDLESKNEHINKRMKQLNEEQANNSSYLERLQIANEERSRDEDQKKSRLEHAFADSEAHKEEQTRLQAELRHMVDSYRQEQEVLRRTTTEKNQMLKCAIIRYSVVQSVSAEHESIVHHEFSNMILYEPLQATEEGERGSSGGAVTNVTARE